MFVKKKTPQDIAKYILNGFIQDTLNIITDSVSNNNHGTDNKLEVMDIEAKNTVVKHRYSANVKNEVKAPQRPFPCSGVYSYNRKISNKTI